MLAGPFAERVQGAFRKTIWRPFVAATKMYGLLSPGDRIMVCISGGKDSFLLALLLGMLAKISPYPIHLDFVAMDPGFVDSAKQSLAHNADVLQLPLAVFHTDIFEQVRSAGGSACYLCARMRRGHLYAQARARGCTKIALAHHASDVVETTLMGLFYGSQLQVMMPRIRSKNFAPIQLIRPLFRIFEVDILRFWRAFDMQFATCGCPMETRQGTSKRAEIKALLAAQKKACPNIEKNILRGLHQVNLRQSLGTKDGDVVRGFLDMFGADSEKP